MNLKCQAKECYFCASMFLGRQHRHTEGWSPSIVAFLEEALLVTEFVKHIIQVMEARDDGEPYQLRRLKD